MIWAALFVGLWLAAAPDPVTLRVTRGAAGAARGVVRGAVRRVVGGARRRRRAARGTGRRPATAAAASAPSVAPSSTSWASESGETPGTTSGTSTAGRAGGLQGGPRQVLRRVVGTAARAGAAAVAQEVADHLGHRSHHDQGARRPASSSTTSTAPTAPAAAGVDQDDQELDHQDVADRAVDQDVDADQDVAASQRVRPGGFVEGWRSGVQAARARRADGRDLASVARRGAVAGARGVASGATAGAAAVTSGARLLATAEGRRRAWALAQATAGRPFVAERVMSPNGRGSLTADQFAALHPDEWAQREAEMEELLGPRLGAVVPPQLHDQHDKQHDQHEERYRSINPTSTIDLRKQAQMSNAMQTTELDNLTAVNAEAEAAVAMCEALTETVARTKEWAAGLADRWSGSGWGTAELDQAIGGVAEAASTLVDGEALGEALAAVTAAVRNAEAVAEAAAEVAARGDVAAFAAS